MSWSIFVDIGWLRSYHGRMPKSKIVRSLDYKHKPRIASYRLGAERRGLPFELTPQQFDHLVAQSCHYCGNAGPNGIDRKDNDLGYSVENCVTACLQCNYSKGSHHYDLFRQYIDRLVKFATSRP